MRQDSSHNTSTIDMHDKHEASDAEMPGTPLERKLEKIMPPFQRFIHDQVTGSVLLIICTIATRCLHSTGTAKQQRNDAEGCPGRPARSYTTEVNPMDPLLKLEQHGQSYWLDNLTRAMITNGELQRRASEHGLRSMTSKPAIFRKAIAGSRDYDSRIEELLKAGTTRVRYTRRSSPPMCAMPATCCAPSTSPPTGWMVTSASRFRRIWHMTRAPRSKRPDDCTNGSTGQT